MPSFQEVRQMMAQAQAAQQAAQSPVGVPMVPARRPGIQTTIYRAEPRTREAVFDTSGMQIPGAGARLEDRLAYQQQLLDAMQAAHFNPQNSPQMQDMLAMQAEGQKALGIQQGNEAQMASARAQQAQAQANQTQADIQGRDLAYRMSPEYEASQLRLGAPKLEVDRKVAAAQEAEANARMEDLKFKQSDFGKQGAVAALPGGIAGNPLMALDAGAALSPDMALSVIGSTPKDQDLLTSLRNFHASGLDPGSRAGRAVLGTIANVHRQELAARRAGKGYPRGFTGWDYSPGTPESKQLYGMINQYLPAGQPGVPAMAGKTPGVPPAIAAPVTAAQPQMATPSPVATPLDTLVYPWQDKAQWWGPGWGGNLGFTGPLSNLQTPNRPSFMQGGPRVGVPKQATARPGIQTSAQKSWTQAPWAQAPWTQAFKAKTIPSSDQRWKVEDDSEQEIAKRALRQKQREEQISRGGPR